MTHETDQLAEQVSDEWDELYREVSREAGESITVVLPLPAACLSPNARCSWRTKSKSVRKYREAGFAVARQARGRSGRGGWRFAEMTCKFYFRDRRRRDPDNLLASMKSAIDGFVDAGILTDDSGLVHRPVEIHVDRSRPRVEVTITGGIHDPIS